MRISRSRSLPKNYDSGESFGWTGRGSGGRLRGPLAPSRFVRSCVRLAVAEIGEWVKRRLGLRSCARIWCRMSVVDASGLWGGI